MPIFFSYTGQRRRVERMQETSHKKGSISPFHLFLLAEKYGNKNSCLTDLRIITICLLGYSGFLRFLEIVNIRRSDISFQDQHVSIFIQKSITDKYNEGSHVCIAEMGTKTCPVYKKKFGLHSLRSGGATAAAAARVNDRIFKKHGRWKSETAKDSYVRETLSEKLSVSSNLGI
ncbi:uncharacterized protein [Magallana gigas]|uniref:uncharacterized protein n=1 Tax=Magallana gigas TaxID=29159 RepID=UPI0033402F56